MGSWSASGAGASMRRGGSVWLDFCALCRSPVDGETAIQAWTTTTVGLAERFALSAYDAAHLELAQRHRLPLATLDRDLRAAATALGLTILGS
jgi:predicted nucleic acid-binding protein